MYRTIISYITLIAFLNTYCVQDVLATMTQAELRVVGAEQPWGETVVRYPVDLNKDGQFVLDGEHFEYMQMFDLELESDGVLVGQLTHFQGQVYLRGYGTHSFYISHLPLMQTLRLHLGGSVTFETLVNCAQLLDLTVGGKATFQNGFRLENREGFVSFAGGELELAGKSLAPLMKLANLQSLQLQKIGLLECGVMVTEGMMKSFKAFGELYVGIAALEVESILFNNTTQIAQAKLDVGTLKNTQQFSVQSLWLRSREATNTGQMFIGEADMDNGRFFNTGDFKARNVQGKGSWTNGLKGHVVVEDLFRGNFANYSDDGSTAVWGLATVKADTGRLTGAFKARNAMIHYLDDVSVPKSASFTIENYFALHSGKNMDFHGSVLLKSRQGWQSGEPSAQIRQMLRNIDPGAYLSAKGDLNRGGHVASNNSSIHFSAGGKYKDVGGSYRSGFFDGNNTHIQATQAKLGDESKSFSDSIVIAKLVELMGTRDISGALRVFATELIQLKDDKTKAGSIVAQGQNVTLGGTVELSQTMQLNLSGFFKTLSSNLIKGGAITGQANEASLAGRLLDLTYKLVTQKDIVLEESYDAKIKDSFLKAENILHKAGSSHVTAGANVECAKNNISLEKGAYVGAKNNLFKAENAVYNEGRVNVQNKYHADTGFHYNINGGRITARHAVVDADWWNVNFGGDLSADVAEVNTLVNVNAFGRLRGRHSLKVNAILANVTGPLGIYQSNNYTCNSLLQPHFYIPGYLYGGRLRDLPDFGAEGGTEPGIDYLGWARTGLSMGAMFASGDTLNKIKTAQVILGVVGVMQSAKALWTADRKGDEGNAWRPSRWAKRGGELLALGVSAFQTYQGASGLYDSFNSPTPVVPTEAVPLKKQIYDMGINFLGGQVTENSLFSWGGSVDVTGHVVKRGVYTYDDGWTFALTKNVSTVHGADTGNTYAYRSTVFARGDYQVGGAKHIWADYTVEAGGKVVVDKTTDIHATNTIIKADGAMDVELGARAKSDNNSAFISGQDMNFAGQAHGSKESVVASTKGNTTLRTGGSVTSDKSASVTAAGVATSEEGSLVNGQEKSTLVGQGGTNQAGKVAGQKITLGVKTSKTHFMSTGEIEILGPEETKQEGATAQEPKPEQDTPKEDVVQTPTEMGILPEEENQTPDAPQEGEPKTAREIEHDLKIFGKEVINEGKIKGKPGARVHISAEEGVKTTSTARVDLTGGSLLMEGKTNDVEAAAKFSNLAFYKQNGDERAEFAGALENVDAAHMNSDGDATVKQGGDFKAKEVALVTAVGLASSEQGSNVEARVVGLYGQGGTDQAGRVAGEKIVMGDKTSNTHIKPTGLIKILPSSASPVPEAPSAPEAPSEPPVEPTKNSSAPERQYDLDVFGKQVLNEGRIEGEAGSSARISAEEAAKFLPSAFVEMPGGHMAIQGRTAEIDPASHANLGSLSLKGDGIQGIPELFTQTGQWQNWKISDHVAVATNQYVVFSQSARSASHNFELHTPQITVTPGLNLTAPGIFVFDSTMENLTIGHGTTIGGDLHTSLLSGKDVVYGYEKTVTYGKGKHKKDIVSVNFSTVTVLGGSGIEYEYKDPETEVASIRKLGINVHAGGQITGTGVKYASGTGDIRLFGVKGVFHGGDAQRYISKIKTKESWFYKKESVYYDTAFCTPVMSTEGKVQILSSEGGFTGVANLFYAGQGADIIVHGAVSMPFLSGKTGKTVTRTFRDLYESSNRTRNGVASTATMFNPADFPARIWSETGDVNAPGFVYYGPESLLSLKGNKLFLSKPILNHSSNSSSIQWSMDYSLMGHLKSLDALQALKDTAHDVNQGSYGDALMHATSPSVEVGVDMVNTERKWQTTGPGSILAGELEKDFSGGIYQTNGYEINVLGDAWVTTPIWEQKGAKLRYSIETNSFGIFARANSGGPSIGLRFGGSTTKGYNWQEAGTNVGGTHHANIGHLDQDVAHMNVGSAEGGIDTFTSRSRQDKSKTKGWGVSVEYNLFTQQVTGSANYWENGSRKGNHTSGFTAHNAHEDFSIRSANLRGANLNGVIAQTLASTPLPADYKNRGYSLGLTANLTDAVKSGDISKAKNVVAHGGVSDGKFSVQASVKLGDNPRDRSKLWNDIGTLKVNGIPIPLMYSINREAWNELGTDLSEVGSKIADSASRVVDAVLPKEKASTEPSKVLAPAFASPSQVDLQDIMQSQDAAAPNHTEEHGDHASKTAEITEKAATTVHSLEEAGHETGAFGHAAEELSHEASAVSHAASEATHEGGAAGHSAQTIAKESEAVVKGAEVRSISEASRTRPAAAIIEGVEELFEPIIVDGHIFKYRITGTNVYLESADMWRSVVADRLFLESHPSPYIQKAYSAFINKDQAVFYFDSAKIPNGTEGQMGASKDLANRKIEGPQGTHTVCKDGDITKIPGRCQDPPLKAAHESAHYYRAIAGQGYFTPGHVPGNPALSQQNVFDLLNCYGADAKALGFNSFKSMPRSLYSSAPIEGLLMYNAPWVYFEDSFKAGLGAHGMNLSEPEIQVLLKQADQAILNGKPLTNIYKDPRLNEVFAGSAKEMTSEIPAFFTEADGGSQGHGFVEKNAPRSHDWLETLDDKGVYEFGRNPAASPVAAAEHTVPTSCWKRLGHGALKLLPVADAALHVWVENSKPDTIDLTHAMGRAVVPTLVDAGVYGSAFSLIAETGGSPPAVAVALVTIGAEFIPDYSDQDIVDGMGRLQRAIDNKDPLEFLIARREAENMLAAWAIKPIGTSLRHVSEACTDTVNEAFPKLTPSICCGFKLMKDVGRNEVVKLYNLVATPLSSLTLHMQPEETRTFKEMREDANAFYKALVMQNEDKIWAKIFKELEEAEKKYGK